MAIPRGIGAIAVAIGLLLGAECAVSAAEPAADSPEAAFAHSLEARDWLAIPSNWNAEIERRLLDDAQQGDAAAEFTLGMREAWVVWEGQKYAHQDQEAVRWFERAAGHGHANAQYLLGMARGLGKGTPQNWNEAARALQAAAGHGHPWAIAALASLHERGLVRGARPDTARAMYRRAADAGNAWAMVRVGAMAQAGHGGKPDAALARRMFGAAAALGEPEGAWRFGSVLVGARATSAEGIRWLSRAAEAGQVGAQRELATLFAQGRGVPRDAALAASYLDMAARRGDVEAARDLARRYAAGDGVPRSAPEAVRWWAVVADAGRVDGALALAAASEAGRGTRRDLGAALRWYALAEWRGARSAAADVARVEAALTAAERVEAHRAVAVALADADEAAGRPGVAYDAAGRWIASSAVPWFRRVAAQAEPALQARLALRLKAHAITEPERREAFGLLARAAARGHAPAALELARCCEAGEGRVRDMRKAYVWALLAGDEPAAIERRGAIAQRLTDTERRAAEAEAAGLRAGRAPGP